ncbi:hypothetical protein E2C05_01535 [Paracraurococcus ruber]|nr:hypothetical protein E2C05_01535 [Paracraurococcus ruber]
MQFSPAVRNAALDAMETAAGTAPTLEIRSGGPPANTAAADTGTVLATMTLPSDWLAAASAGSKALLGTWQDPSADATGTAGHFRIKQAGTTHFQGVCGQTVALTTSGATAAAGAVLTFASTTGAAVGMLVTGTGVPANTYVIALTSTTVTMSQASSAGVSSGASITFSPDLAIDNASIAAGQQVTATSFTLAAGGA